MAEPQPQPQPESTLDKVIRLCGESFSSCGGCMTTLMCKGTQPMLVTFYVTIASNLIVAFTCTCIWAILYMNVALQFFVAAETAYFSNDNKPLHAAVTLGLLPTILVFWTFIMWFILSRQVEIILLIWSTPYFSAETCYAYLGNDEAPNPHYCTWSEVVLGKPFGDTWNGAEFFWSAILSCVVVCLILGLMMSYSVIPLYGGASLLVVLLAAILMLWSIVHAGKNCSWAFLLQWVYFIGCAITTAGCSFIPNGWPDRFVSTAVVVYITVMFAFTSLYMVHQVWVCPLNSFWNDKPDNRVFYALLIWPALLAFVLLVAVFIYIFNEDRGGGLWRLSFLVLWLVVLITTVLVSVFISPHGTEARNRPLATLNADQELGASTTTGIAEQEAPTGVAADPQEEKPLWATFYAYCGEAFAFLFIGVLAGSSMAPRPIDTATYIFIALFGPFLLALLAMSTSIPDIIKFFANNTPNSVGQLIEQCGWKYFQAFTVCLLIAELILISVSDMWVVSLFLFSIVFHGYALMEYHMKTPSSQKEKITIGVVEIADIHYPKKRLFPLVLLVLFVCNTMVFGLATWSFATSYKGNQEPGSQDVRSQELDIPASEARYGMCTDQDFYSLDVVDLAFMTELTYFKDPTNGTIDCGKIKKSNLQVCLSNYFTTNYTKDSTNYMPYNWTVLDIHIPDSSQTHKQAAYYGVRSEAANLVVVGVRGSTTGRDWLEDFNLYSEASLLQLFSLVVPMTYVWPYEATAAMVKALSFTQMILYSEKVKAAQASNYYKSVQSYAEGLQSKYNNSKIMLIGHSLGAATAQIAAARMNVRGFGFEPPGTVYSHEKFGIPGGMERLDDNLVSVIRHNDPVVYVDTHAGEVQQVVCKSTFLTAYCHYMHPITCHLMANCGALQRETFDHWGGGYAYCNAKQP